GRLISENVIAEHDGVGLQLKDIPACVPGSAEKLCTLSNFEWVQVNGQEIESKKVKPKKEHPIEKNKNVGEECHRLCLVMTPADKSQPDSSSIACVAYTFSDESRK